MTSIFKADWLEQPPEAYNAASDFIDGNVTAGRGDKVAIIDDAGSYTYAELAKRVNRAGNALKSLNCEPESRVAMIMHDSIDFPAVFWGAIKAGIIPLAINTLLTQEQYRHILGDSRARVVIVSAPLLPMIEPLMAELPLANELIVAGDPSASNSLDKLLATAPDTLEPAQTFSDDVAFWLFSSGSTGNPKGAPHLHRNVRATADLYGTPVLGIEESDIVFSAAKLFFAYGLGNAMTFPLAVGATAVLMAERPTPDACMQRINDHNVSIFFGVPTLFGAMLANPEVSAENSSNSLRRCVSAGEALPEDIGKTWETRFPGVPILDGIGSTEMLHIFLSNAPDDYRYGTSGKPVPGYTARLVDETGNDVARGDIGDLHVAGPSACQGYWNQRGKSLQTFLGPWTVTGDKYFINDDGYYVYCGRGDDMFKVSGNWVSPFEVESALITHPAILEAAVVPHEDGDGLYKPKAFVILNDGSTETDADFDSIKNHTKDLLSPWKYPRWVEYVNELPKTATGKIQRFKLRQS